MGRRSDDTRTGPAESGGPVGGAQRLDDAQLALWSLIYRTRAATFLVLATVLALLPDLGATRVWVALGVLALVPYNAALERDTMQTRKLPRLMFVVDQFIGAAFALAAPLTWDIVLLILLADVCLVTVSAGRRDARLTAALGTVLLAAPLLLHAPARGGLGLAVFVIMSATVTTTAGLVTDEERRARRRYGDLVDGLDAIVWEALPGVRRWTFVSRRAESILGYDPARWIDEPGFWAEHIHPDDRERVLTQCRTAEVAGVDHDVEYRMVHADGRTVWLRDMVHVGSDESGRARLSGVLIDVTAEKRAEIALRHQATHDALTGLPNRVLLGEQLQDALDSAAASGRHVALVLMDLDQFKEVNDTLGHHFGDVLLATVGRRLSEIARPGDLIARLGGDEFALVLTKKAQRAEVDAFLRRLQAALAQAIELPGISLRIMASMGVAMYPEHGLDAETLVRRADVAMYTAKRSGGGHAFYDPDRDRSSIRRLALATELHQAIEGDELVLHFQPKIDVRFHSVVGAEALVRWQHPEHGLLPPSEFVEMASMSGMIQPLTEKVLELAMRECRRWASAGLDLSVAVNLSVLNLYDPRTSALISDLLHYHRLPGERLVVEVTESDVMEDPVRAVSRLQELNDLGVRVAIDDFGTGYSSLSHLRQLPIHELKIDRSFVAGMADDESDGIIVQSIIDLSHNLGLQVVAEGVETGEILDRLKLLGCDQAQGYHLGRPLPGPQFDGWLSSWIRRPVLPVDAADLAR